MGMTRQRTIAAELWRLRKWVALDPAVRFTAIGLQASADDHGRGPVEPLLIKADIYPMTESVTADVVIDHVLQLDDAEFLTLYQVGPETFFQIVRWPRVDRPNDSDIPSPPAPLLANGSGTGPERLRVVEGESRGRASERERAPGEGVGWERSSGPPPDPGDAPDPFCIDHPDGTERPCKACGTARLRHARYWQLQRQRDSTTEP